MHIKRFEAPTLTAAIAKVKAELGPDALVLSHRSVRRDGGRFGWFGKPVVEVIAALDREPLPASRATPPDPSWKGLSLTKSLVDPLEAEVRSLRRCFEALREGDASRRIEGQLGALREAVGDLQARFDARRDAPEAELEGRLEAAGFLPHHARTLAAEARRRFEEDGTDTPDADANPRLALARLLIEKLDARMPPPRSDEAARVSLLVGATGVGKTTTIAKLAAHRFECADDVALLTTDTYRVGADEQLRVFAQRLGVRFGVATSPEDLSARIERLGRRHVFVDTAGRSGADSGALPDLKRFRDVLAERAQVQLVVAATTSDAALRAERDRFAALEPDSLIVTKVDEVERLSNIANLVLDDRTPPLVWLATGQRVPEDLEVPHPGALAVRMLGVAG